MSKYYNCCLRGYVLPSSGIVAIIAGIVGWIINGTLIIESLLLQISAGFLIFVLILGIIYLHLKVKQLLEKLEVSND